MRRKLAKQKITFSLTAPQAKAVLLAADFTDWEQSPLSLNRLKTSKTGLWKAVVALLPGSYEYRFLVDGQWQDDPQCSNRCWNRYGTQNCVCEVK